jgi:hypothetical protein
MDRRAFITTTSASLLALPLVDEAQEAAGKPARIGYLSARSGISFLDEAPRGAP